MSYCDELLAEFTRITQLNWESKPEGSLPHTERLLFAELNGTCADPAAWLDAEDLTIGERVEAYVVNELPIVTLDANGQIVEADGLAPAPSERASADPFMAPLLIGALVLAALCIVLGRR
jgi:hypothetical protein